MKTLSNNSSKKERTHYLNHIIDSINNNPRKMDDYIYDLVGMQGMQFKPKDDKFKEICIFAIDIEICTSPLYKDKHAIDLFVQLEAMVSDYSNNMPNAIRLYKKNFLNQTFQNNK